MNTPAASIAGQSRPLLPVGSLVRYSRPLNAEEATFRFRVVEDNGDRIHIEDASGDYPMAPIEIVSSDEVAAI